MKRIATGMPFTNLEETEKYYEAMCVKINLDPEMEVHCSVCVPVFIVLLFYQVIISYILYIDIQFINLSNKVIKSGVHILANAAAI